MKNKKGKIESNFVILIHRHSINGLIKKSGFDRVIDCLINKGERVILIENELETGNYSRIKIVDQRDEKIFMSYKLWLSKIPFRWILEIFYNLNIMFRHINIRRYIIAVDPLNFLSAYFFSRFHRKVKIYFHAIDFSESRFESKSLNTIYNFFFRFALKKADKVSVVSKRMLLKFQQMIPSGKYTYLPNSPVFRKVPRIPIKQREKYSLGLLGVLYRGINYEEIVRVVKRLVDNFSKKVKVYVVGDGDSKTFFESVVHRNNLDNNFIFCGMKSHRESLSIISRCYIGITYYSNTFPFQYYGDSIKIREYAACGLPIVADGITSTAEEAWEYRCGDVFKNTEEMFLKIKSLFENEDKYKRYSKNALKWAKKFDKEKLVKNLFS